MEQMSPFFSRYLAEQVEQNTVWLHGLFVTVAGFAWQSMHLSSAVVGLRRFINLFIKVNCGVGDIRIGKYRLQTPKFFRQPGSPLSAAEKSLQEKLNI